MTQLSLRSYQREAINHVFAAWNDGMKRPAVVLPTGAGKTVVFSHLIREFRSSPPGTSGVQGPGNRVMILVHRDELADQAVRKIKDIAPGLSVGKVKAEHNYVGSDVMVCSVQTLASPFRLGEIRDWSQKHYGDVGLIITDECHHGAAVTYQKIYEAFPDAYNLGVTATMARGDGVGLGSTWDDVVYKRSVLWMISQGYLADVRAVQVEVDGLDLAGVMKSRGDFQAGDLGQAMADADADHAIADAYAKHAPDRQGIVFCPTVETATLTAAAMNAKNIKTAVVSGETPSSERHGIFEDFRTGKIQALANCMVLTEGFDAPWASCAVIARPTQSNPLYIQMVGRVLRTWPGKKDALVLDVVGAGAVNKLRTLIDLEPGAVSSVEEDETLAEAVIREAEAANQRVPAGSLAFSLKSREVDLFAASRMSWLRTQAGILFISCGTSTVFLWPSLVRGAWDVCVAHKGQKWERTAYTSLDLSTAMAWGEAVSEDYQNFSVLKAASWRKSKPSDAQVSFAEGLGIDVGEMNRGQLSDAISVVMASRQFDSHVPQTKGA